MITFKDYITENAYTERIAEKDLPSKMGKKDFNALIKSKEFSRLRSQHLAIKYGVTSADMHMVEVYPYQPDIKDEDGKIAIHTRHDFVVYNGKIASYQRMTRKSNSDTTWR